MTDDTNWERLNAIRRRRLLQGIGGAGLAALAGCSGQQGDGGDGGGDGGDGGDGGGGGDGGDGGGGDGGDGGGDGGDGGDGGGGDGGDGGGGQLPTGRLNIAQAKSPIEFDPIVLNDVPSAEIAEQIFEGLYDYDSGTNFVPVLADGMPTVEADGTRYIIDIKEDATFQNGDPVTAEDVAYSFRAPIREETENAAELNMVDTIRTRTEKSMEFNLKYPFAPFMTRLTFPIVPKSVREADKERFNTQKPVGSGPFEFIEWVEGDFTRIERWDDYWGEPMPNLSEVRFVPVEEPTTRVTTLQTGENDIIKNVPPKLWQQVKGMNGVGITSKPGINYFYLAFNMADGPTADPQVREAIDYTFSMDQAIQNFVAPSGVRQYSPLPKAMAQSWNMPLDEWKEIPHGKDIDRAKSMLDDADSVPSNWQAKIIVPPDNKREQIGLTVANGIEEAGYRANVQRLDWAQFLNKYNTGDAADYNMFTLGWAGSPDPDAFLYFLFHKSLANPQNGTNGAFYTNDQVSSWIGEARRTPDRERRQELYQQATTKILEDRVHIPAYGLKNSFGVKNYVQNFEAHPIIQFPLAKNFQNVGVNR